MSNPKSFECSVQQFYEPVDSWDDGSSSIIMNDHIQNKQSDRPMTGVSDTNAYCLLNTSSLTEFIRNDLDLKDNDDPIGSLFQDLSGWEIDLKKAEKLKEESCLNYLELSDKKDEISPQKTSKKKNKLRYQVIRTLLKKSATPSIGYRSKNDWGAEDDGNGRPYALDVTVPHGMTQTNTEEDYDHDDIIQTIDSNQDEINLELGIPTNSIISKPQISELDLELQKLIEATSANAALRKTNSASANINCNPPVRRAFSSCSRPIKHIYSSRNVEKPRRGDHIYIAGQKYYNTDLDNSDGRHTDRPNTARRINAPTTLPKIYNEQSAKSMALNQKQAKKGFIISSFSEKKDCGMEIPKWYLDSGTKHTHDRDLVRYMEIMGSKSNLRTPRKLSANGFLSLPMPNKPPEMRGMVIEHKQRASLNSVLDEVIQEQSLKLDVMKVPIIIGNQRSFAEEVQITRQQKTSKKMTS